MMLKMIVSGGQTGIDQCALDAAIKCNIPTGGWMPNGWLTLAGPKPEYKKLYNMKEHPAKGYKARTWANVRDSNGTLRIARDFTSAGEICTLNAIKHYEKPYFDINLNKDYNIQEVANWIIQNNIEILNVAGNSDKTWMNIYFEGKQVMLKLFGLVQNKPNSSGSGL